MYNEEFRPVKTSSLKCEEKGEEKGFFVLTKRLTEKVSFLENEIYNLGDIFNPVLSVDDVHEKVCCSENTKSIYTSKIELFMESQIDIIDRCIEKILDYKKRCVL